MRKLLTLAVMAGLGVCASAQELYRLPAGVESRWSSFENPKGEKGAGAQANDGAKGAPYKAVKAGETVTLMEAEGSGTVRRIWATLGARDAQSLRSFVIRMYWDGEEKPAVEAPFGDFFGYILGQSRKFESAFFSNPEGRSFNCFIPMPFRKSAKITFSNESDKDLPQLFYDVNYTINEPHPDDVLYFHAYWHRVPRTELRQDFEILPAITGGGRYLGAHIGIIGDPALTGWWGEGEVKIFLDGDKEFPTLAGTGTEDYVGTAYGQGEYNHLYQGSLLIDNQKRFWTFYRLHVPDPVYFHKDIRVTIQRMGGNTKNQVKQMIEKGAEVTPVSVQNDEDGFFPLLDPARALEDPKLPDGWTNIFRRDDVSAVGYFYLNKPTNELPAIQPLAERTAGL